MPDVRTRLRHRFTVGRLIPRRAAIVLVLLARQRHQDNPTTKRHLLGRALGRFPLFQLCPLARAECDGKARFTHPESFVRLSILRKAI